MNDFVDSFAYWLADYGVATTLLLSAALVALALMRQPAKRLAVVKAVLLALMLLAGLCAVPGWSLVYLATTSPAPKTSTVETPAVRAAPAPSVPIAAPTNAAPVPANAAPLAAAAAMPHETLSWLSIALAAYALGSVATLLWLAVGMAFARRLLHNAVPAPHRVEDTLTTVVDGMRSPPRLRVSNEIDVAAALGVRRPTVLLPSAWANGRSASELRTVLAHECAHVRNGDLKWLALGRLLSVVLWPQPLYWLLRRRMRLDQESLADAAAAELTSRVTYAEQLVAWARAVPRRSRPKLASAVGLWESASQLRRRVAVLLDERFLVLRECSRRTRWVSFGLVGLVALALSIFTLQPVRSVAAGESNDANESGALHANGQPADSHQTVHSVVSGGTFTVTVAGNPATPWDYKPNLLGIRVEDVAGKPLEEIAVTVYRASPRSGEHELVKQATTNDRGEVEFAGLVEPKRAAELQELVAKSEFPMLQGDMFYAVLHGEGLATVILPASDFQLAGHGIKRRVRMRPASELSGRVADSQGKPVGGRRWLQVVLRTSLCSKAETP